MRFKMIGYGRSFHRATTGETVEWPIIGLALQKNYISVYFVVTKRGAAVTDPYAGHLGELRMGRNNFSLERFDDLESSTAAALFSYSIALERADEASSEEMARDWSVVAATVARKSESDHLCSTPCSDEHK